MGVGWGYSKGAPITDIHPSRSRGTPIKQGGAVTDRGGAAETWGTPINNHPAHRYPTVTRQEQSPLAHCD